MLQENAKSGGAVFRGEVRNNHNIAIPEFVSLCGRLSVFMARTSERNAALELGKEYPAPGEPEQIREIVALLSRFMERTYPPGNRPARRQAHTKPHGLVTAEFQVETNLPAGAQCGVFKPGAKYQAWIRFSSGSSFLQSDKKLDVRGMAIKLMGVEGEKLLEDERFEKTQDFLLIDTPGFLSPNAADYLTFTRAIVRWGETLGLARYILGQPLQRMRDVYKVLRPASEMTNPLTGRYTSTVPYKLGSPAVHYAAKSWDAPQPRAASSSPDFFREAMVEHLKRADAHFDFMIQFQTDPVKMPVEDATVVWDAAESPYIKVATIRIPMQVFDTDRRFRFAENLSFTPWHSLPEHQPLGVINRIRKAAYEAMSRRRHDMNDVPRKEPVSWDD